MTETLKTPPMTSPERLQMIMDYRNHIDNTVGCECDETGLGDCVVCELSEAINEICEKISEVIAKYKINTKEKSSKRYTPNTADEEIGKQRMEDHPGVILVGDVLEDTPSNRITTHAAMAKKNLEALETLILDDAGIPCVDLSSAKINDTLYSRIHGGLVIHSINPESTHPIMALTRNLGGVYVTFDGKTSTDDSEPTVFFRTQKNKYHSTRPAEWTDWSTVPPGTDVFVKDSKDAKPQPRRFLFWLPGHEYPFFATNANNYKAATGATAFRYCELMP